MAKRFLFQTTLEGVECVRRSDAGWQSVPGTQRSDEERAVMNDEFAYCYANSVCPSVTLVSPA